MSINYSLSTQNATSQEGITHAQCWVHGRRYFIEAQKDHPEQATEALQQIAKLYQNETAIKNQGLIGEKKRQYRLEQQGSRSSKDGTMSLF
jgi:hypothetical protein